MQTLRSRMILPIMLALVPALALTAATGLRQRQVASEQVAADAARVASLASDDQDRYIEQIHQLLAALAHIPDVQQASSEGCSRVLADIQGQYPSIANLGVISPDGLVTCSALPFSPGLDVSDRGYFQRTLATGAFASGDYQIGRITGLPSVNFGYPLVVGEELTGVVFAALDLGWLNEVGSMAELPPDSTLTLIDHSGTVLVRYPDQTGWLGRSASETALFAAVEASGGEGSVQLAGLDETERLYAFTPLGEGLSTGATVVVGIPAAVVYGPANRALAENLIGLTLLGMLSILVAWAGGNRFVLRPMRKLVEAAEHLGRGDLTTRTALPHDQSEFGQLALSFDSMAQALEVQEAGRRELTHALEARERQYRLLFNEMRSAFALQEMLYDEQGAPYDYCFLQVNPAFERMFGAPAGLVEGKTARQLAPEFDDRWLETFARVVDTGKPAQYEDRATFVNKDLEVTVYRPEPGQFACMFTDITARKAAEDKVQQHLRQLRALRTIDLAITSSLDPRVTFDVTLDQVTTHLAVDAASLLVFDRHTRTLNFGLGRGFRTDALRHTRLQIGHGLAGKAALDRQVLVVPDLAAAGGGLTVSPLFQQEGFLWYAAAPLLAKGEVKGVLEVFHRQPLEVDQEWLDFLETLAGQAAIAIDNAALVDELLRSNQELAQAYDTTLEGWAAALDLRDDETQGHSIRVTEMTLRLARELNVPPAELAHMRRGALLHDIGKIGIPDSILLKPGPLTDDEWEVMRRHPTYAHELLAPIAYLQPALDIPYSHHERWDGNGYPRRLAGETIPVAARIFAVVDVWDALSYDRPYRDAWPREDVLQYLRDQAGAHFDPKIVESFLRLELALAAEMPAGIAPAPGTAPGANGR